MSGHIHERCGTPAVWRWRVGAVWACDCGRLWAVTVGMAGKLWRPLSRGVTP